MFTSFTCVRFPWLTLALVFTLLAAEFVAPARSADLSEATTLFRSGEYAECERMAAEAVEQRAYSETWRVLKLQSQLRQGRYVEALATLDEALERFPTSVRLRWFGHTVCRLNGQADRADLMLDEIDELVGRSSWRYRDPESRVILGRYYLERGGDARQVLQATFDEVKKQRPDFAVAYLAAAQLALDKHDYQLAAEELAAAEKLDAANADVLFALARAYAPSDSDKVQAYLNAALERNPNHVDSLLFVAEAHLDAERYGDAEEVLLKVFQVNPLESHAWALRCVIAHLQNRPTDEAICRAFALSWWAQNPRVDYLIGRELSQKYRFTEGAAYQRRALARDSQYLAAKIQLSQDLLRLGEDEEGWRLAEEVYQQDGYNVVAHNLVTLQDNLTGYRVLHGAGLLVRMEANEAEIYGRQVISLLEEAKTELCAKYDVELPETIKIEIFPRQADFAIRTFGLPGGDGFLGVCFGPVITANSPASRVDSPVNWESVLWHEFCHVVTLRKTNNKMPRWLSEGISVYEERQADPRWGESLTAPYREMILSGQMTAVSKLSGAFLNPPSPLHLQFAYFESSLVVEHLIEEYGLDTLKGMLVDLGVGMPINEVLQRYTGSLAALDQEFEKYAKRRAEDLAPEVDWEKPPLDPRSAADTWAQWVKAHPTNLAGLLSLASRLMADGLWQEAETPLREAMRLYPTYHGADSGYALLARVYRELGDVESELDVLSRLAELDDDDVATFTRLMELHEARGDARGVITSGEQLLAVNPLIAAPHRYLARAAESTGETHRAIAALEALLRMDPRDPADIHYRLAKLQVQEKDYAAARRHVLMSLEEAPRYRDAHELLLEIVEMMGSSTPVSFPRSDQP